MKQKFLHILDVLVVFALAAYLLLDTFVIPRTYSVVTADAKSTADTSSVTNASSASITDTSYTDDNISIKITASTYDNTVIYTADVQVSDASYLQTAFANSTYGKNITASTSSIADSVGAILAINGDFYGARSSGYVIRNGVLYRDTSSSSSQEDLVISKDGSFSIITEGSVSTGTLLSNGAQQVLSFGPALIENGEISVSENQEVGQAMTSNPRTAICEIGPLHYLLVVADGRTSASEGLSLYQMAQYLQTLGVSTAYNLDGGGSSTMVFNGTVINNPTTNGNKISERSVSDIVYIGA
ncbi:MAG: phosphodiester glycosidase family protein [Erysipelotrichaceae bacterium]|nr:phosphodiester glycosidase family protein [Erysipelotrichaceae bacterium]